MAKKTENRPNVKTTYSSGDAMDADLRPNRQQVKQVRPGEQERDRQRTARVGETPVSFPVKGANDPE